MHLSFSPLNENTDLGMFDCGDPQLNSFLENLALLFQQRHFGVTIIGSTGDHLVGYYTLCPASIQREELPLKMITGPRPNPIPGFRICRLAVDKRYKGKGYGKMLFVHALKKCVDQADQIGGSVIIIDAKDEGSKQFYTHFGFVTLPERPLIVAQTIKNISRHFN